MENKLLMRRFTWPELVEKWKWADISDAQFLQLAHCLGKEHKARKMIVADIEVT